MSEQKVPVLIARLRLQPRSALFSAMRSIATRTARVTLSCARSETDAARRSRPPQSNGAFQFGADRIDLVFDSFCVIKVAKFLGLFESYARLVEPTPVSGHGPSIGHLAGVIGDPRRRPVSTDYLSLI